MALQDPIFPSAVWDGVTNANRKSRFDDINPDHKDYDAVSAEIIAVEDFITNTNLVVNPRLYTTEAGENITAGAPLYITPALKVFHAQAIDVKYQVAGLALDYTLAGENCDYFAEGSIELTDWMAVAGTITLTIGDIYYLDNSLPGRITNIVPVVGYVVRIGRAMSETKLDVETFSSVKL